MNEWYDAEGHEERAREAYEAGRWAEAESELREALSINPYQAEYHFNLGLTLEAAGRFAEAVKAFGSAHELAPDDSQAPMMIGVNLLRMEKPGDAIAWLEMARKASPNAVDAYIHLIEARTDLGEHDEAEVLFYIGQEIDPNNAGLYAAVADSLLMRGKHERALWCLREARTHQPDLSGLNSRMAAVYEAMGQRDLARRHYLLELRKNPGDIETLLELGCLLAEMELTDEAGEKFRRVLELNPSHAEAHFQLGDLALNNSRFAEAQRYFETVLAEDPTFKLARVRLAAALLGQRVNPARDRARELLTEEFEQFTPGDKQMTSEDLDMFARSLLRVGLAARAVTVSQALCESRESDAEAMHLLGVSLFHAGQTEEAIATWRKTLEVDSRHASTMVNLIVAHAKLGRWRQCASWAKRALANRPGDHDLRRVVFWLRIRAALEPAAKVLRSMGILRSKSTP